MSTSVHRGSSVADPRVVDVVLGLAMALVVALVIAADTEGLGRTGPVAYLFALGFGAAVLLRRHAPRVLLVLTVLGVFVYYILGFAPIGMALPAVAALFSAAEQDETAWAIGGGGVLLAAATYFRMVDDDPTASLTAYDLVTNIALVAAAIALGVAVRLGREARERTEQIRALTAAEQAHAADQRRHAERMRLARDLHDVVGHNLAVVALHAGVAAEAVGGDDQAARAALAQVRASTSETLDELRATVKLLRESLPSGENASDRRDAAPPTATSLARIDALVGPARATGLDVATELDVDLSTIDGAVDAAAFRIVQEALTNVMRHARAERARITAVVHGDRLRLEVSDDGHGAAGRAVDGAGAGIAGMRERAELVGGTLVVRDSVRGFTVAADLPVRTGR